MSREWSPEECHACRPDPHGVERRFRQDRTFTASCRAAASARTAQAGSAAGKNLSSPRAGVRLPVQKLFLTCLKEAFQEGKLRFHGELASLASPAAFEALCRKAKKIKWVVYAKAPFAGPDQVLKYLAGYTHRVAISNSRILSIEDGKVTFLWKDYADGNKTKTMTLDAV